MRICLDMRTGAGCGTENPNHAHLCSKCGKALRFALTLHDAETRVGRYRIVRVIGYGAYGAVYEATEHNERQTSPLTRFFSRYLLGNIEPDDSAGRVALKETFDASSISSFAREFSVLSGLNHANLPRYIDMFEAQGNGYLVMEYVPGQSLQEILDSSDDFSRSGPEKRSAKVVTTSQVLGYALQLCDVLEYLHSQQPPILHRDIKPANIRLTPEGRIKLVDFGLLKQAGYQTRATIRGLGTAAYAPIEQYTDNQQATDVRSDIYSLGSTLYHLFSGQAPPSAPNRLAGDDDVLPPLPPTLSSPVRNAVVKGMSLKPRDRFANISQFRQALQGIESVGIESVGVESVQSSGKADVAVIHAAKRAKVIEQPVSPLASLAEPDTSPDSAPSNMAHSVPARPQKPANYANYANYIEAVDDFSLPHLILRTGGHVLSVTYSADGQHLYCMTNESDLYQWRVSDGQLIKRVSLAGKRLLVRVAISPDGQTVAGAGDDLQVRIWRRSDGRLLHKLGGHTKPIKSLAYTPDGQILAQAGGEDKTIRLSRVKDGRLLHLLKPKERIVSLKFSPSGHYLACGSIHDVQLYRMIDGRWLPAVAKGCYNSEENMTWSADEQLLLCGSYSNVYLWHLAYEKVVKTFKGHQNSVNAVVLAPDAQTIASGGADKTVRIWSFVEPHLQHFCRAHQDEIRCLAYAPNGQTLASGSQDGTVRLWQLPNSEQVERPVTSNLHSTFDPPTVQSGLFRSQGVAGEIMKQLSQTYRKQLIPAANKRSLPHLRCQVQGNVLNLAFSADGQTIVSMTDKGQISKWRIADGMVVESYSLKTPNKLLCLAMSPDGQLIASATDDLMLTLWRLSDGQRLAQLRGHTGLVNALAFSPDGSLLVSSSIIDETVRLWQVTPSGGKLLDLLIEEIIYNLNFSPKGDLLATGNYTNIKLWRVASGQLLQDISHGSSSKHGIRWSPDGQLLACGKLKQVQLLRAVDGEEIIRFEGQKDTVISVAWHPNGQMVASGGYSNSIRIWSVKKPHLRHICQGHKYSVTCLAVSQDGRVLASGSNDQTVRLWQLPALTVT